MNDANDSGPDLRFLQANERTLLAWIRTALALMAFGFVLARISIFAEHVEPHPAMPPLGVSFVVLGVIGNVLATIRFVKVRNAILAHRPVIPGTGLVFALAGGLAVSGTLLAIFLALA